MAGSYEQGALGAVGAKARYRPRGTLVGVSDYVLLVVLDPRPKLLFVAPKSAHHSKLAALFKEPVAL